MPSPAPVGLPDDRPSTGPDRGLGLVEVLVAMQRAAHPARVRGEDGVDQVAREVVEPGVDRLRRLDGKPGRVSPDASLTRDGRREEVDAVELTPEVGGPILRDAFSPYLRGRLTAALARLFVPLERGSTLDDYVAHVRSHPMFELRARPSG